MYTMSNLDHAERDKFADMASDWWSPDGRLRTLHDINPCRVAYLAETTALAGCRVADIGCGGGILSEALGRSGARITAIDAAAELIAIARDHAAQHAIEVDYRVQLAHELAAELPAHFDLVTCMELLEHVPDPAALVANCATLLRPGGQLVVSTLDRSPMSYVGGVLGAEYVLGLLPRGTHDYNKFIRPAELAAIGRANELLVEDIRAMHYNPLTRTARLGRRPRVNYLARLRRRAASIR